MSRKTSRKKLFEVKWPTGLLVVRSLKPTAFDNYLVEQLKDPEIAKYYWETRENMSKENNCEQGCACDSFRESTDSGCAVCATNSAWAKRYAELEKKLQEALREKDKFRSKWNRLLAKIEK